MILIFLNKDKGDFVEGNAIAQIPDNATLGTKETHESGYAAMQYTNKEVKDFFNVVSGERVNNINLDSGIPHHRATSRHGKTLLSKVKRTIRTPLKYTIIPINKSQVLYKSGV